jgi:hypothetical protein
MKGLFVDFETAKMLKGIKFKEMCICFYETNATFKFNNGELFDDGNSRNGNWLAKNTRSVDCYSAPLWQQAERWLWDNHKIIIQVGSIVGKTDIVINLNVYQGESMIFHKYFNSPIAAKNEGIKAAVIYLHEKLKSIKQ